MSYMLVSNTYSTKLSLSMVQSFVDMRWGLLEVIIFCTS